MECLKLEVPKVDGSAELTYALIGFDPLSVWQPKIKTPNSHVASRNSHRFLYKTPERIHKSLRLFGVQPVAGVGDFNNFGFRINAFD